MQKKPFRPFWFLIKKSSKILTIRSKTVEKNGKSFKNTGIAARGQLHKESVYGKRKAPHQTRAYHIRNTC